MPNAEEEHLRQLCQVLNDYQVDYIIFGSSQAAYKVLHCEQSISM